MISLRPQVRLVCFVAALLSSLAAVSADAQVATLGKGHQILVNNGLQIWGLDTGASSFNYNNLTNANFNGVIWSWNVDNAPHPKLQSLTGGQKWGKWTDPNGNPATALDAIELSKKADLIALQVGDEQQTDIENPNGATKAWFQAAHAGNHFPNQLLYTNSFYINNDSAFATFVAEANPDAISFDAYPFNEPYGQLILPQNWLSKAGQFRRHALSSYIGVGGNAPRPYGMYLQTYQSTSEGARHPGDLEMRWQQFTAWTMGFTFVDAFTVGGATSLFTGGNMSVPSEPRYSQFKETARQSQNLGPALVRLISYGYGPSIALGKDPNGATNPVPFDWLVFNKSNAPANQQYLTGVSAVNLGTKNNGQPGDVYIGFFNPLHTDFGNPAGTTYFMVTNGLGAYLNDPTLSPADCMQRITLDFDFTGTAITSLQRLRRSDGQVELVPLSFLGGNQYQLVFDLEGGTGDLFKYNDGLPFVGVQSAAATLYWDADANAANNNLSTGSGLGGSGSWDNSSRWYNGTANTAWTPGAQAVFSGAVGSVTLGAPQSASGLSFKTNGYSISGSTLTLSGPYVSADAGVTATISSAVAGTMGFVKSGAGTVNLAVNNSYTGGTTINEGVLGIVSGALGANPASPTVNVAINNGATLRFNQNNLTLTAQRQVMLGAAGGVFDTAFNNGIAGAISGGRLTKTGSGTLTLSGSNAHSGNTISGGALVVSTDANLGAAPSSFTAGNITLDGGTLRFGGDFDIHNNRGITLEAGGGTLDTQGFSNPTGYAASQGGFRGPGDLTKMGSGTFFAAATSIGQNSTWKGRLVLKEGTWKIVASDGLPYNPPAADGLQAEQVTLDGGTWQIGETISITNGRRGIMVAAGGGTIDTPGIFNLTWAGPIAGGSSAVLQKTGSGILRFTGPSFASSFQGTVQVNAGTLRLDNANSMGPQAAIQLADAAGVTLHIAGTVTVGSLAGGGSSGGNVTLSSTLTAGGDNNSTTFAGIASGSGNLVKTGTGTLRLTNQNTYSGFTNVIAGTLAVDGQIAGSVAVQNGATLRGSGNVGGTVAVQSGGIVAPGNSPGTLTVGELTMQSNSALHVEIGPTSDLVQVNNTASLNGALHVSLLDGFMPDLGESFTFLTANAVNGAFGTQVLPSFSNRTFEVTYNPQSVVLRVVPALQGDFTGDGSVDAADYVLWRKSLDASLADHYNKWRAAFGSQATGSGLSSAVPEPSAWMLYGLGGAMLLGGRWHLALLQSRIGRK